MQGNRPAREAMPFDVGSSPTVGQSPRTARGGMMHRLAVFGKLDSRCKFGLGGRTMAVTANTVAKRCRALLGADSDTPTLSLEDYLDAIPRLGSLNDLPSGT